MPRLSPLTIERMQPKATRQEVPDSVTSGLYFIVQPSGVKSWGGQVSVRPQALQAYARPLPGR
jgi:hypothetical protein